MKSVRNKTITSFLDKKQLLKGDSLISISDFQSGSSNHNIDFIVNKTINGDCLAIMKKLPSKSIDLVIADPPYNLTKKFNSISFKEINDSNYEKWLDSWIKETYRLLKENGAIYICCDWKSSISVCKILKKYFKIQNRITWARDKGRASYSNWKNNIEDVFFATKSKKYVFNYKDVLIKRKVIAPYVDKNGKAKDWKVDNEKQKYRLTAHPNIWTDLTIPFWSMEENTVHPTQKPEKLIAKLILASSNTNDIVFDPFLGSGTTSVVAKKLNRRYIGIEKDLSFAQISQKRLSLADNNKKIQGYNGKYFLDKGLK